MGLSLTSVLAYLRLRARRSAAPAASEPFLERLGRAAYARVVSERRIDPDAVAVHDGPLDSQGARRG
jgi:hypothetical protein